MIVVDRTLEVAPSHLRGKERDTLAATWEERRRVRRRARTAKGREVALALPTGSLLMCGALLWVDEDFYVEVEALPEPLLAVHPRHRREALRVAFEVGNRHFSLAVEEEALLVPDDVAMVELLERLEVPWTRCQAIFNPMGLAHRHD